MEFENYEGTAIDVEMFNPVEENTEVTPMESTQTDVVETAEPEEAGYTTQEVDEAESGLISIPGLGEFSADEIKEWRQGSLRQSDYTRKTQELARQREQLQNAENLYNYVNQNPHLIEAMRNAEGGNVPQINAASPELQMIRQLAYNQKAMEVDMKLSHLKEKYGDVDEVALFNKAAELRTEDLEFVYKGLQAENNGIDIESIKQAAIEQAKAELKAELENSRNSVGTTISTQQTQPVETINTLTPDQKRVAAAMGISESEYAKWM